MGHMKMIGLNESIDGPPVDRTCDKAENGNFIVSYIIACMQESAAKSMKSKELLKNYFHKD